MKKLILLLLVIFLSGCTQGLDGPYKVVKVIDGDTIDLEDGRRVRFSGINTPESGECYYQEATDRLTELIMNKEVYLEKDKSNTGKYGRLLRYVYLEDILINELLVEEGYAKVYDKYKADTKRYTQLKDAEDKTKGLWNCKDTRNQCKYVSSKNSKLYHKPTCKWAKKIKPANLTCHQTTPEKEPGKCVK